MQTDSNSLLTGLTPEQRDAVTTTASPLCIIAGAGSGKTRVLTHRIAWHITEGNIHHRQVLAVTFTRRAARELRSRLHRLTPRENVRAGTFHSVALAQLRHYDISRGRQPRRIVSNTSSLISQLLDDNRLNRRQNPTNGWRHTTDKRYDNRPNRRQNTGNPKFASSQEKFTNNTNLRAGLKNILSEISWARARLIQPDDYPEKAAKAKRRSPLGSAEQFAALYAEYRYIKNKNRILDLDDVLEVSLHLMNTQPEHAAAQRWMNQHLLVDEFQDINPLQFALLQSWLDSNSTLVIVGDPDQAIYGWNGADPELINNVHTHFPGCAVVKLHTNFRSTPEILAAAGRVLNKPPQPAFRGSGKRPTITVLSGDEEPVALARAVRNCQPPGAPWRMQAVLARTNEQLKSLKRSLTNHGIPVTTKHATALRHQPEIIALVKDWKMRNPTTQQHWTGKTSNDLSTCIADTRMSLLVPLSEYTELDARYLFTWQREAAHFSNEASTLAKAKIIGFLNFAEDHLSLHPDATVDSFLVDAGLGELSHNHQDGVSLLTFHAAKGLEWPIVHLVGLEDGYVPVTGARTRQARAEEQRLLYVAITRALRELHVTWCDQRTIKDKNVKRAPSPWLEAIREPEHEQTEKFDVAEVISQARQALRAASPVTGYKPNPYLKTHEDSQPKLPF